MFFYRSTIEIDGFSMVFQNSGAMVSDGFDLEKRPKNAHNRDRFYFAKFVHIISYKKNSRLYIFDVTDE